MPQLFLGNQKAQNYSLSDIEKSGRGTKITVFFSDEESEYLEEWRIKEIVQKHSDFIQWPILLGEERINQETALWLRNPADITDEEYNAFYKHISKDWQDPLCHIHVRAEGTLEFNAILFVPKKHAFQLDNLNYKVDLKLYQKRVKVLDHAADLLPRYLRFVTGVVDSSDVELNVSREILQQTPVLKTIKSQLTKKILRKLENVAKTIQRTTQHSGKTAVTCSKKVYQKMTSVKKKLLNLLRCKTTK